MKKNVRLENLDCANCAAKLERSIAKIDGVKEVSINFMALKMSIDIADEKYEAVKAEILKTAKKVEPDCEFKGL